MPAVTTITGAVANVKAWGLTVAGIATSASYDVNDFYQKEQDNALVCPALVVVEELGAESGWQTMAFMGNQPMVEFTLEHHFLFVPVGGSADFAKMLATTRTLVDAYIAALKADPFFTVATFPGTHKAVDITWKRQQSKLREAVYHAAIFRLGMRLNL